MATIEKRTNSDNEITYRAKVRLKGYPPQTATFSRLTDERNGHQAPKLRLEKEGTLKQLKPKNILYPNLWSDTLRTYYLTSHNQTIAT